MDPDGVSARFLGLIKGFVGMAEKFRGAFLPIAVGHGDSRADGNRDFVTACGDPVLGKPCPKALRQGHSSRQWAVGRDHDEFFATVSGDQIAAAYAKLASNLAATRKTSSPVGWPNVSLIALK